MFSDVLQDVASRVQGLVGLVVMGMDGIPIERVIANDDHNFDMLATESTTLLRSTAQASADVGAGGLRELIFMTDQLVVITVAITPDYVLYGVFESGTNYGQARFQMKRAAIALEQEFL